MKISKGLTFKIILFSFLFTFINIWSVSSQIAFGIKGGYDIVENKINKDILNNGNRLGFHIGPVLKISLLGSGWGIDTGVLYGYKKYEIKEDQKNNAEISNYHYLMVPLNLRKEFSILGQLGAYAKAGPYAEIKLNGGDFNFSDVEDKIKSKTFGAGINLGAGITLFGKLDIGMDYRFKLTDNYDEDKIDKDDFKNKKDKTWNVNLTYYF